MPIPTTTDWLLPAAILLFLLVCLPAGVLRVPRAARRSAPGLRLLLAGVVAVSTLALAHEAGHAAIARLLSLEVHGLLFAAAGGCCIAEQATCARQKREDATPHLSARSARVASTARWEARAAA